MPYKDYIRQLEKKQNKQAALNDDIVAWRKKWAEYGPVRFAQEVLACPRDVPFHPGLGRVPEYIILTDDQKEFLMDLAKRSITQGILAAGRGAGKTFCLAIYVAWRITCFDYFTITVMGGSAEQSSKIKEYVDYWRVMSKEIDYCINRSVSGGNRPAQIHNRWGSYARFPACSETAARGPHVTQVIIDEVCVGESKSSGGALAIRSARGQLTSSAESLLMYTSTAQYIFGTFFNTWRKAEKLGFKKYRWSVGRYYDEEQWFMPGTKEPNWNLIDTLLYKDRDPKHWKSNVWWITDEDVKNYRINGTDDEFLVEVLGGISRGSGLVFSRDDLAEVICNGMKYREDGLECDECHPYDPERCPMMKAKELEIAMIGNRKMGVDFGEISPNAVTLMGERGEDVYVLFSDERTGSKTDEILQWIDDLAKEYSIFEIFADPEERAMRENIEGKGYSTPNLWAGGGGGKKNYYVTLLKRYIEQHRIFIPKKFTFLTNSLIELAYDTGGDIRKHNDHSFDSAIYACSDYDPDFDAGALYAFKNRQIGIWG